MLATAPGYELDVDRGPDWLWIRVRGVRAAMARTASLADEIKEVVEKHFVYRVVLELDACPSCRATWCFPAS